MDWASGSTRVMDTEARKRILIVEDEPFIALTLEDMLAELGFEVAATVSNVQAALDMLDGTPVDAALLDINLGEQKIDPVADLLAARRCPFLFTTGYGRSGIPANHSGRPVLQKPFQTKDLADALCAELGPSVAREPQGDGGKAAIGL